MMKNKNKFKHYFYTIFLFTSLVQLSYAQNIDITHGPFIQYLTTNSVVVNWSSSTDCVSWVEYYEKNTLNSEQKEVKRIYSSTEGLKNIGRLHKVTINNLNPYTKYSYRIYFQEISEKRDLGDISEAHIYNKEPLFFTTLEIEKEVTSCIILCDMHENTSQIGALLNNTEWNKTDFVLLNGDFINRFNKDKDLYNVIDTCVDVFAKEKPLYVVRGNHEIEGTKAHEFNQYLHFPDNKYYYTFSSGSTLFLVLDSGFNKPDSSINFKGLFDFDSYRSTEAEWLTKVVKSEEFKKAKHKIVFMHIPPFIEDAGENWHGAREISEKFVPILNKAGIDLMISGHLHQNLLMPKDGNNNFPIIVSDMVSRINLLIDSEEIKVKIEDVNSKVISEFTF